MYDPTIFENLKVALENHVYDLETIGREIKIMNRVDRMDFAILTRYFAIQFSLADEPDITAEIQLVASLKDLSDEILEVSEENIGCSLSLRFIRRVQNVSEQCKQITEALNFIWEDDIQITQTLNFEFGEEPSSYLNVIDVKFKTKINEEHMGELSDFLDSVVKTLEVLIEV